MKPGRPRRRPAVLVVGAGRLGVALARGLVERGWSVASYARSEPGRRRMRQARVPLAPLAQAGRFELIFLAVPDEEVAGAARDVERYVVPGQVVAHCAGALSLAPLAGVRRRGGHAGSLHPVQAFAGDGVMPGATAAVAGDRVALRLLARVASGLRLRPVRVPERGRVLYHAACVMAANHCMALADLAVETWVAAGAPRERAIEALVPLMRGAIENLASRGLPAALTGPAARGDAQVVARQRAKLRGDAAEVYRLLTLRLVRVAQRGGLDARKAARVRRAVR